MGETETLIGAPLRRSTLYVSRYCSFELEWEFDDICGITQTRCIGPIGQGSNISLHLPSIVYLQWRRCHMPGGRRDQEIRCNQAFV
jgi:hypothetical protein